RVGGRARRLACRGGGPLSALLLAVDGGNAKTDLVLADREGRILSLVRGPGSSPHEHGVEGALDRIEALVIEAGTEGPVAYAELLLAGDAARASRAGAFRAHDAAGAGGGRAHGSGTSASLHRARTDRVRRGGPRSRRCGHRCPARRRGRRAGACGTRTDRAGGTAGRR